jgi:SPP1 gp7 family putative phage head morphogenesis protein
MSPEQLRLFIRQAFALEGRQKSVTDALKPEFLRAMANIRQLVNQYLPDDGILREQQWRALKPLVVEELRPFNDQFQRELFAQLSEEAPEMVREAQQMIEATGAVQPAPQTFVRDAPSGLAAPPVADTTKAILRTKVGTVRLATLFDYAESATGTSRFIRSNADAINKVVTQGIMQGTATKDIADQIAVVFLRSGEEYISEAGPTAARKIWNDSRAIARTAVQDANAQVHAEVYKANEDQLDGLKWEWVAALDSRTCPTCAPLDGTRKDKRTQFPVAWPAHINCRCRVVAVDPDEAADVRSGIEISPEKMTAKDDTERLYATKVKVKGQKFYRKAVNVEPGKDGRPPTYADFLAQANPVTQQQFFGGGNAGSVRAERFRQALKTSSPEKALRDLINTDKQGVGRFEPVTR